MPYQTIQFKLWAVIDGTEIEVVQCSLSYEMNRIPHGVAVLPVGRKIPGLEPSAAHDLAKQETIRLPCKIFLEATPISANLEASTLEGTYTIFEGYVTGIGYRRGVTRYQLAAQLQHWLVDLNNSSSLSESSHPHNPAQFTFNAAIADPSAGSSLRHFLARTAAQRHLQLAAIQQDLWGQGIRKWFEDLASIDRLNVRELGAAGNDDPEGKAKEALGRFDDRFKTPIDIAGAHGDSVARAIWTDISASTYDPSNNNTYLAMANVTLWDKLVGDLGPSYMFSVIPFAEKAAVVPFIPGLRQRWDPGNGTNFTILARDLDFVDMNTKLPRALRALGIFAGRGFISGANLKPNDYWKKPHIGGMYEGRDNGLVMFKQSPRWLSEAVSPFIYSKDTTTASGQAHADNVHPGAGQAPGDPDPETIKGQHEDIMKNMAQALYANEILKGRIGQLSGSVRLDICPGSNVSIEGAADSFLPGVTPVGENRYATVIRTSLYFDTESDPARAGTGFNLAHIRTEQENESDDTSVDGHPLYTATFPGFHLIEAS